jgi:hypothetical protein
MRSMDSLIVAMNSSAPFCIRVPIAECYMFYLLLRRLSILSILFVYASRTPLVDRATANTRSPRADNRLTRTGAD